MPATNAVTVKVESKEVGLRLWCRECVSHTFNYLWRHNIKTDRFSKRLCCTLARTACLKIKTRCSVLYPCISEERISL